MSKSESDINVTINEIAQLKGLDLPKNKAETKRFRQFLSRANQCNPIDILVGSCPDYSHTNGKYTHVTVGEGIPLLSQIHLERDQALLDIFGKFNVPYRYTLMVADVEATDDIFCQKFTEGSENEFLRRCNASVIKTGELLNNIPVPPQGLLRSSSFFDEFGRDEFLNLQTAYQVELAKRYESDSTFRSRVTGDIIKRMSLYYTMYPEILGFRRGYLTQKQETFLVERTIRTMAQYLTLGRLISLKYVHPLIINHPTRNLGMFNDRNKFLLPADNPQPQPTIPVFEMKQEVY